MLVSVCVCSKWKFMMIEKCVLCYSSVTRFGAGASFIAVAYNSYMRFSTRKRNPYRKTNIHTPIISIIIVCNVQWQKPMVKHKFLMLLFGKLCGLWSFSSLSSNVYLHIAFVVSDPSRVFFSFFVHFLSHSLSMFGSSVYLPLYCQHI